MGRDWEYREKENRGDVLEELQGMVQCDYLHILGAALQTAGKFQVCRSGFHCPLR